LNKASERLRLFGAAAVDEQGASGALGAVSKASSDAPEPDARNACFCVGHGRDRRGGFCSTVTAPNSELLASHAATLAGRLSIFAARCAETEGVAIRAAMQGAKSGAANANASRGLRLYAVTGGARRAVAS